MGGRGDFGVIMGRPKIVAFTGLEDTESQDSRPAKKKKQRQDEKQTAPNIEQVTEAATESPEELTSELAEASIPATESVEQLSEELVDAAKSSDQPEAKAEEEQPEK